MMTLKEFLEHELSKRTPRYIYKTSEPIYRPCDCGRHRADRTREGKSRFDLYYETGDETERTKGFIEVKGVALEEQGVAMFPDAPTVRGTKHIYEMIDAVRKGYEGTLFFLIQMKDVCCFRPNRDTDPDFAHALTIAAENGVRILAYDSVVTEDGIVLGDPVEVQL